MRRVVISAAGSATLFYFIGKTIFLLFYFLKLYYKIQVGIFGYLAFSNNPREIYKEDNGGVILLANYNNVAIYIV